MITALLSFLTLVQANVGSEMKGPDPVAEAEAVEAVYEDYHPLAEALFQLDAEARQDHIVARRLTRDDPVPEDLHQHLQSRREARRTDLLAAIDAYDPIALVERAPQTANFLTRLVRLDIDPALSEALMARFEPLAGTPALHRLVYDSLTTTGAPNDEQSAAPGLGPAAPDKLAIFKRDRARHAEIVTALGAASGRDQFVRSVFVPRIAAFGADAGGFIEAFQPVITAVDADNADFARKLLDQPGFAVLHAEAPDAAQRIVDLLHHGGTDADKARLLALIEPLAIAGEFDGQSYALMHDRLAESEGRPQRYGTQDACTDGRREIYTLEDPERVDARRAAFGMMPLAEYRAILIEQYGAAC